MQLVLLLTQDQELTVTALHLRFKVEQSMMSHHLINLKDKGILSMRRQGKHIYYSLAEPVFSQTVKLLLTSKLG